MLLVIKNAITPKLSSQNLSHLGYKLTFFTSEGKADSKTLDHVIHARPALHSMCLMSIAPPVADGMRDANHIDGVPTIARNFNLT
jgi:CheY-like chemotaxis protein